MTTKAKDYPLGDVTGGEASIYPLSKMPTKYSSVLQNCHISERGGIAKIPGYEKVNSNDVGVGLKNGFKFIKNDGTKITLTAGGGNIYKYNSGTGQLDTIKTGLDANAIVHFSQQNDICLITNGVDAPLKYDGTTVSALGGTPPSTAFKTHPHKGRVWMIERTNKMLATHSALNNVEDYTSANDAGYIDFKFILPRGDELVDISTYIDLQVFWFKNHIAIYSGTNPTSSGDYRLVQLIEGVGTKTDAVKEAGTDMAFLFSSGVKTLKQVVTTGNLNTDNEISEKIEPTIQAELKNSPSAFAAAHYPARSWLMLLIGSTIWIYSYTWKAWGRMVGADVKGMFDTTDDEVYLCGSGFLYKYGEGWDFAGVLPKFQWKGGWKRLSKSGQKMFPKMLECNTYPHAQTNIDFYLEFDMNNPVPESMTTFSVEPSNVVYIDTVTDWDAIDPFDEIQYAEVRIPLFGGGRSIQTVFENTSALPVEINDLNLLAVKGGH